MVLVILLVSGVFGCGWCLVIGCGFVFGGLGCCWVWVMLVWMCLIIVIVGVSFLFKICWYVGFRVVLLCFLFRLVSMLCVWMSLWGMVVLLWLRIIVMIVCVVVLNDEV